MSAARSRLPVRASSKRLAHAVTARWRTSVIAAFGCLLAAVSGNASASPVPPTWQPKIVAQYPHDPLAFTQGLELHEDRLFETTGRYRQSQLREVARKSGAVVRSLALPDAWFGEGLTIVDDEIFVLTWREQTAGVYDRETFAEKRRVSYEGEGWGICGDANHLWTSNGSAKLALRDRQTFVVIDEIEVHDNAGSVVSLNELECAEGYIFANVWGSSRIVVIEPASGEVRAQIDGSRLLDLLPSSDVDVLNGIAYDQASKHFFLTGKLWPTLYEVSLPEWEALIGHTSTDQTSQSTTSHTDTTTTNTGESRSSRGCSVAPAELAVAPFWLFLSARRRRRHRA